MFLIPLAICLFTFVYLFYVYHRGYWNRMGIPGPSQRLFFGNFLELVKFENPNVIVLREWTKKYGKVYGMSEGIRKIMVVSDPNMLYEIFIKKFAYFYARKNDFMSGDVENDPRITLAEAQGMRWKRLRTICAPTFSTNSLKKILHTIEDTTFKLMDLLEKLSKNEPIDIHNYYKEFSMDIISRIALGQSESTLYRNPLTPFCQMVFGRRLNSPIYYMMAGMPFIRHYIRKVFIEIAKLRKVPQLNVFEVVRKTVDERIAQREKDALEGLEPEEPKDFVDFFLNARADDTLDDHSDYAASTVTRVLTKDEIISQCFVFLIAGFDTTANALAYTSWMLANHPVVQRKVQEEISRHCTAESVSFDDMGKMKYLECVIKEVLRFFPLGASAVSRTCMKDIEIDGVTIEKGVCIWADSFSLHFNKELWGEDADEFLPERWQRDETRHPMAWIPFGAGPRICIGQRLAYLEEKMALIHLLRKFSIVAGPKTERALKLVGSTTVAPESVTVYLQKRYS